MVWSEWIRFKIVFGHPGGIGKLRFHRAGRHTQNDTDKKITLFVAIWTLHVVCCELDVGCCRSFGKRPMEDGRPLQSSLFELRPDKSLGCGTTDTSTFFSIAFSILKEKKV